MAGSNWDSVVFGLASAAAWGAGDFSGGLASKRTSVYGVVIASQVVGIILLFALALIFAGPLPTPTELLWGGAAGMAGAIGLIALYRALATGQMGVAAPVSAVLAAGVPVVFGALIEGLPGGWQMAGFGLALIAVWFISRADGVTLRLRALGLPLVAGLGFGAFFVLIDQASATSILWPVVAARAASISTLIGVAGLARQPAWPERRHLPLVALSGMLDAGGNAFFMLAAQAGRLDVASVLSSLYPASTVGLAWLILKERLTRAQLVGIVAALAAIILITL